MHTSNGVGRGRLKILGAVVICLFSFYAFYLFRIQIIEGYLHSERARATARRFDTVDTIRGTIYDRNGRPLAEDRTRYALAVTLDKVPEGELEALISRLSGLLAIPAGDIAKKLEGRRARNLEPVEIGDKFVLQEIAYLVEHADQFPGVKWYTKNYRYYPEAERAAHVVGYTGQISGEELQVLRNQEYHNNSIIGKSGVERQYDTILRGKDGSRYYRVDAYGREIDTEEFVEPVPGRDLILTIDANIQNLVWNALGERAGAAIVIKPASGEVLAMVSNPSFNPNLFYTKYSQEAFKAVSLHPHSPFINRAIQSSYPPASTFKIIMTTAIIEEQIFGLDQTVNCSGSYELGNRVLYDWRREGFGHLNIFEGLAWSSNVFFWTLGLEHLGLDHIIDYSLRFGFGVPTGIDLPNEASGNVPSPEWKSHTFKERWSAGDTANFAIGQGFLTTTPIQVANMISYIANGGRAYRPFVLSGVRDKVTGAVIEKTEPELVASIDLDPDTIAEVRRAMSGVIEFGTARSVITTPVVEVAGKTGTGQVANTTDRFDSWFVAYAPFDAPPEDQVAVVVFVDATNKWEWWAPKAANIIIHGVFTNTEYSEAVNALRRNGGLWYL